MSSQKANGDAAQSLVALNAELLKSGRYSDLTISCRGKIFKVHRNIVALQSRPLAAAIDGDFKESKTGVIDLEGDDPNIIEKFIHFLYTQQYDDGLSQDGGQAMYTNVALYVAGEKFDVAALKTLATDKYEEAMSAAWDCASFTSSLKLLYAGTPETDRRLRDVAIKAAATHVKELVKSCGFIELCSESSEIAVDVLKACFLPSLDSDSLDTGIIPCPLCKDPANVILNMPRNRHWGISGKYYCPDCWFYFNEG